MSASLPRVRSIKRRILLVLVILSGLLVVGVVFGASIGPVPVPFGKTMAILVHRMGIETSVPFSAREMLVVDQVRLPRVLVAVLVGAALGTSGTIMQGLFRNPLADPGIIGVSSGAAAGAVLCIASGWSMINRWMLPACAFFGAMASIAVVFGVWASGRQRNVSTLLLVGIGVNSLLTRSSAPSRDAREKRAGIAQHRLLVAGRPGRPFVGTRDTHLRPHHCGHPGRVDVWS